MNSSPSQRCGCPKVKRSVPELRSVPTQPRMTPTRIIQIALGIEPEDSETAPISPTTISEKYSAAPKRHATVANGAAKAATTIVPTQPAENDAIAAVAIATPARPVRAICSPSLLVQSEGAWLDRKHH